MNVKSKEIRSIKGTDENMVLTDLEVHLTSIYAKEIIILKCTIYTNKHTKRITRTCRNYSHFPYSFKSHRISI